MKRKNARKAASGRKGTVDEELYLLGSFSRLVDKFKTLIGASRPPSSPPACQPFGPDHVLSPAVDATPVLDYLLIATLEHRRAGTELQQDLIKTETAFKAAVDKLWPVEKNAPAPEPVKEARPVRPAGVGEWRGGNGFLGL